MTMESQNKDFHWVNHQMVENRVSGAMLDSSAPKSNLLDVCNLRFLPSMEEQKCQRLNYVVLCSRILVNYFDVLTPLADASSTFLINIQVNYPRKQRRFVLKSTIVESTPGPGW